MQSITYYNTSDEHGSEGACISFIQSHIKSQKQPLILYSEFEPNSRQRVLRQPSVSDNEVPMEYCPHSSALKIKLFSNSPFSLIVHLIVHLMALFPLVDY